MNYTHETLDMKIVSALDKLCQIQRTLLWETGKKENLSPIQMQFLAYLSKYPSAMRRVSVMADEFGLTKATVSEAIDSLDSKGLVKKIRDEEDRRSYVIELSRSGISMIRKTDGWRGMMASHAGRMTADEKRKAYNFMVRLIKSLHDDGIIRMARLCVSCGNYSGTGDGTFSCRLLGEVFPEDEMNIGCEYYNEKRAVQEARAWKD